MQDDQPAAKRQREEPRDKADRYRVADKHEEPGVPNFLAYSTAEEGQDQALATTVQSASLGVKPLQTETVSMLMHSGTPTEMAIAAASGTVRLLPPGQAVSRGLSTATPVSLQQDTIIAVADSPEEEVGRCHISKLKSAEVGRADQTKPAALGDHASLVNCDESEERRQRQEGTSQGGVNGEATEVADQLPLSYPATLVATLPCTMPAWLAQSQRTVASSVLPTQIVTGHAQQPWLVHTPRPAAAQQSNHSLDAVDSLKGLRPVVGVSMPQGASAVQAAKPAKEGKPKCRLVTRLSQPGATAQQSPAGMPDQKMEGLDTVSSPGRQQGQQQVPDQDSTAAARAGLQQGPLVDPVQARAAAVPAERVKRRAECSPAVSDADKAAHKRARSDSPVGVEPCGHNVADQGTERTCPSDADVQVWILQRCIGHHRMKR